MAIYHLSKHRAHLSAGPRSASDLLTNVLSRLLLWSKVAAERRDLAELDERMLRDIGLRRDDALQEAKRPFWRTDGR